MGIDFSIIFRVFLIIGIIIGLLIAGVTWLFTKPSSELRTKHKLEPYSYEVLIKNGKADTTWLYKIK